MKLTKLIITLLLATSLVGCFKHGFEGAYKTKAGSSNELVNVFAWALGSQNMIIGSNYIESNGKRQKFEKIFVRKSGNLKYLVFRETDSEQAWKILDENTLIQGNDLVNVKLVRVTDNQ